MRGLDYSSAHSGIAQLTAPGIDAIASIGETIVESLPDPYRGLIKDVPIIVKDWPDEQTLTDFGMDDALALTGLYLGVPVGERLSMPAPPAEMERIELYRLPILFEWCERGVSLIDVVFDVLTHEIGHHFGMDERAALRMEGRAVD